MAQKEEPKKSGCFWCFNSAKWKREEILDHSFNLVNVNDYVKKGFVMRLKYLWIYFVVFKTVLVYMSDLYLLVNSFDPKNLKLDNFDSESCTTTLNQRLNNTIIDEFNGQKIVENFCKITKEDSVTGFFFQDKRIFILLLCSLLITYLLSILELQKAQRIIKSKNISFAYTNIVTYRYYCIKSYAYYCFFQLIQNNKKRIDDFAFFVFFTFKGWKRFVFADSLRRILNIALFFSNLTNFINNIYNDPKNNPDKKIFTSDNTPHIFGLITSGFILSSWIMTGISLLIAFIIYLPLLSVIQGNLKEYCCHKIDKRIAEIINSKTQEKVKRIQKLEKAKLEAAKKLGVNPNELHLDESQLKKKDFDIEILPDPTLPKIDIDLNDTGTSYYPTDNRSLYNHNNGSFYNNQFNKNNQFNNNNNNLYGTTRSNYQPAGSVVAYSDYNDNCSTISDNEPYNMRNRVNTQPQPQYMNPPYGTPNRLNPNQPYQSSPFNTAINPPQPQRTNTPYGGSNNNSGWNNQSPPPNTMTTPPRNQGWNDRNQGWNDQMSTLSSTYSNASRQAYRRNNNRPGQTSQQQSFDTNNQNQNQNQNNYRKK